MFYGKDDPPADGGPPMSNYLRAKEQADAQRAKEAHEQAVKENHQKIIQAMREGLKSTIGQRADKVTCHKIRAIVTSQLYELAAITQPVPKVEFDALPDPRDPTMITFKPGNAWTALTLAMGTYCPDYLPVPAEATMVCTRAGTFTWNGYEVEFVPISPVPPAPSLVSKLRAYREAMDKMKTPNGFYCECYASVGQVPCQLCYEKDLIHEAIDELVRLRKKCGE
jgi:hypothetical protein